MIIEGTQTPAIPVTSDQPEPKPLVVAVALNVEEFYMLIAALEFFSLHLKYSRYSDRVPTYDALSEKLDHECAKIAPKLEPSLDQQIWELDDILGVDSSSLPC